MKKSIWLLVCSMVSFSSVTLLAEDKPPQYQSPSIEVFTSYPAISGMKLSPDGKHIADIINYKGALILQTQNLSDFKRHGLIKFDIMEKKMQWFEWANNSRLLVSIGFSANRSNVHTAESRLFAIDLDGKNFIELMIPRSRIKGAKSDSLRGKGEYPAQFRDDVIDFLPDDPDHILVSVDFEEPTFPSVYEVNINTGRRKITKRFHPPIRGWITDRQGRVRAGYGYKETRFTVMACDPDGNNWRVLCSKKGIDSSGCFKPLGFGTDPNILYIRALHDGRDAVFAIDLREEFTMNRLIAWDETYDISGGLIVSPKSHDVIGVYFLGDAGSYLYWNDWYKALQSVIDKALPNTTNYIINLSKNEKQYILFSTSMFNPGTYYLGDLEKRNLEKIGESYPELTARNLAGKKKVTYKARDGFEITGFLTIPKGSSKKPYPTIIHPHGGPAARDFMGYDYWTEFFASRGYAVLQMEFRGSGGYGADFLSAGFKNWGLKMQDDITDGTLWLIDQGIADSERIAIVGASYGGYAALMGAVKTPDLYRCAVSFAGVSDLKLFLERERQFTTRAIVEEQIGSRFEYGDQLEATSPARHADKIKIPVFIAHGDDDLIVDINQSERMVKALEKNDKSCEYLKLEGGDHGLSRQDHRTLFFKKMDAFLAKHLKKEKR